MSKERELLEQAIEMIQIVPMMASIGNVPPDFGSELLLEIKELLAQPEKNLLIEKYNTFLRSLIENNGEGLKELKAFDLETYNKLKEFLGQVTYSPNLSVAFVKQKSL
jgi:hypothetical protein